MEKQERTRLFYQNKGEKTCERRPRDSGRTEKHLTLFFVLCKGEGCPSQSDLQSFMYKDRLNGEDVLFERGRQRDRVSLHNFTARNVSKEERQILNYGGDFVMKGKPTSDGIKKQRAVKKQTELAVLSYVEYLAGVKVKVRVKGGQQR